NPDTEARNDAILHPPQQLPSRTASILGKRVLFMDDEPGIRRIVEILLKRLGLQPTLVTNGEECLVAYKQARDAGTPFDLVILDLLIVGGLGGKETITELRKLDPKVRAIVSSGYSDDPILAHPADYGFSAVVPKPYEISTLSEAIRRVLALPAD
ncbi:MAG TPA: response regulator, partial [Opitutaceae bacterium]|nr:response regulator [Opitutaceae bacterium]